MMPLQVLLLLVLVIGLPIGWLFAEFRTGRPLRITLGVFAILCSFGVASIIGTLTKLTYNSRFGIATKDLINTTVEQVEDGQLDRVMKVLRALNRQYHPTYENRADYCSLVRDATARMRGDIEITKGSDWDAATFDRSTWLGHWENDAGFWIVIDNAYPGFRIIRSGHPENKMTAIVLSDDRQILTFHEDSRWRHTLTLVNKYEAKHYWFDLEEGVVWATDRLHKLIKPERGLIGVRP